MKNKLAIVHEQLAGPIGGAESVFFGAIDLFPEADTYSVVVNPKVIPPKYKDRDIKTTFIQNLPFAKKIYKAYFPIMPLAIESLNLQEYNVILSSHHCIAKGIIPNPEAVHICYCHTPARYIWDLFWTYSYANHFNRLQKLFVSAISQYLRIWDITSANRVDYFLANSSFTAARIKKFYNRDSEILYPPVETAKFNHEEYQDYYFMAGRLVSYKGFELAIRAFNESGKRLIILGNGPEYKKYKSMSKSNIEFLGATPDNILIKYMNNCRGYIAPGKEDFGIVMAEAQSAGKPVISFNEGGANDIVEDKETGILFNEQSIQSLNKAIDISETFNWNPKYISNHAKKFDKQIFLNRLTEIINNAQDYKLK